MDDLISRLSELRCQYNCFDENERDAYHALSEAIKALSDVPDTNIGDTINRQAAIDAIRASTSKYTGFMEMEMYTDDDAVEAIKALPSAQPEIIRCKDCKWYGRADKRRFYRGMDCLNHRIDTIVPDKDYCSRAERRTDA